MKFNQIGHIRKTKLDGPNSTRQKRGSRTSVPDQLIEALHRTKVDVATGSGRAVAYQAAKRHFGGGFWRNYMGRSEMKQLRSMTKTTRPAKAIAEFVGASPITRKSLRGVSHAVLVMQAAKAKGRA